MVSIMILREMVPIGMLMPVDELTVVVGDRYVKLQACVNCCRAIMKVDKETGYGYTHWGLNSTRCPDLDDGREWDLLPKAQPQT